MKIISLDCEQAQVGNYVLTSYGINEEAELINSIEHNAGIKPDQCNINGLFWNYEDMIVIRIEE